MSLFNKQPKTMGEVFELAIAQSRTIQEKNRLASEKLEAEQTARAEKLDTERKALEAKFKEDSATNESLKSAADKEVKQADVAIGNFAKLFGRGEE